VDFFKVLKLPQAFNAGVKAVLRPVLKQRFKLLVVA
jgi:hypothetical protein